MSILKNRRRLLWNAGSLLGDYTSLFHTNSPNSLNTWTNYYYGIGSRPDGMYSTRSSDSSSTSTPTTNTRTKAPSYDLSGTLASMLNGYNWNNSKFTLSLLPRINTENKDTEKDEGLPKSNLDISNKTMGKISTGLAAYNQARDLSKGKVDYLSIAHLARSKNGGTGNKIFDTVSDSVDSLVLFGKAIDDIHTDKRQPVEKKIGLYANGGNLLAFGSEPNAWNSDGAFTKLGGSSTLEKVDAGGDILGTAGALVMNGILLAKINDMSETKAGIINSGTHIGTSATSSNDDVMNAFKNYRTMNHIGSRDVRNKTVFGDVMNGLQAGNEGATSGFKAGGAAGAIIGGVIGTGSSLWGTIVGRRKARKEARRINELIDLTNSFNWRDLTNSAAGVQANTNANLQSNFAAYGGTLTDNNLNTMFNNRYAEGGILGGNHTNGADWEGGLTKVGAGGTHEENPLEGVPMGADSEGTPNLVEENEVIYNDYVFSARLTVPDVKKLKKGEELSYDEKVIKKYAGKTFAEAAKAAEHNNGVDERPEDNIARRGLEAELKVLAEAQEKEREAEKLRLMLEQIARMSPEEFALFKLQLMLLAMAELQALQQGMLQGYPGEPGQEEMDQSQMDPNQMSPEEQQLMAMLQLQQMSPEQQQLMLLEQAALLLQEEAARQLLLQQIMLQDREQRLLLALQQLLALQLNMLSPQMKYGGRLFANGGGLELMMNSPEALALMLLLLLAQMLLQAMLQGQEQDQTIAPEEAEEMDLSLLKTPRETYSTRASNQVSSSVPSLDSAPEDMSTTQLNLAIDLIYQYARLTGNRELAKEARKAKRGTREEKEDFLDDAMDEIKGQELQQYQDLLLQLPQMENPSMQDESGNEIQPQGPEELTNQDLLSLELLALMQLQQLLLLPLMDLTYMDPSQLQSQEAAANQELSLEGNAYALGGSMNLHNSNAGNIVNGHKVYAGTLYDFNVNEATKLPYREFIEYCKKRGIKIEDAVKAYKEATGKSFKSYLYRESSGNKNSSDLATKLAEAANSLYKANYNKNLEKINRNLLNKYSDNLLFALAQNNGISTDIKNTNYRAELIDKLINKSHLENAALDYYYGDAFKDLNALDYIPDNYNYQWNTINRPGGYVSLYYQDDETGTALSKLDQYYKDELSKFLERRVQPKDYLTGEKAREWVRLLSKGDVQQKELANLIKQSWGDGKLDWSENANWEFKNKLLNGLVTESSNYLTNNANERLKIDGIMGERHSPELAKIDQKVKERDGYFLDGKEVNIGNSLYNGEWINPYFTISSTDDIKDNDGNIIHRKHLTRVPLTDDTVTEEEKNERDKDYDAIKKPGNWPFWTGIGLQAGLTAYNALTPVDNSDANALIRASLSAGNFDKVGFRPIGNYLTYRPVDPNYPGRKIENLMAAERNLLANLSGGNQGKAMAGILGSDYNLNSKLGEADMTAWLANRQHEKDVEDFNRTTNEFNSNGFLDADKTNALLQAEALSRTLEGLKTAYLMRLKAKEDKSAAISAGISGIGKQLFNMYNNDYSNYQIDKVIEHGGVPGINRTVSAALGGKIKRNNKYGF